MNLRDALTPRALAVWAGTDRLSALADRIPIARAGSAGPRSDAEGGAESIGPHATPAAKLFALLVGGDAIATADVPPGIDADLLERDGQMTRARVSVLPLGPSLLVCDRLDADSGTSVVCWPDDSSYHLARAIPPGRRARWLDIATGAAFAPLLRPELAEDILGAELNPRAALLARRGVALSGQRDRIKIEDADLTAGITGTFDLVTCNAPIPATVGPLWRATADPTLFTRLFEQVPRVLAPGGLFVLHAALEHVAAIVDALPGDRVTVSYVPAGGPQFGILWWQPDLPTRHVVARRALTPDQPHLTYHDWHAEN